MDKYSYSPEQRALLERNPVPYAIYQFINKRVVTLILSDGFCDLFGYDDREAAYFDMDHDMYKDTHPDDKASIADAAYQFATEKTAYNIIYRTRCKKTNGYKIIHAVGHHIYTETGIRLAYVGYTDEGMYSEDAARQGSLLSCTLSNMLHEDSILRSGYYDHLTGLPSMTYFFELADAGKAAITKAGGKVVMLFLDLCGMKYYNTKYGFSEGDKLLLSFAKLLSDTFSNENCCRIGADHFAVYTAQEGIEDTLRQLFRKARLINGGNTIPVHVGIYISGSEPVSVSGAYDRSKIACDSLKNRYGSCFDYYRTELKNNEENRQYVLSNLDKAIENKWIQVYYQGIVRAVTGKVSDEEALARWIDPEKGRLSPAEFIPYLEDAGLIFKLDLYVLDQVLEKLLILKEKGLSIIPHSINLSRSDFDACDIVEEIRQRVDAAGVDRDRISIELTESIIGSDFDYIKRQIERFRELGFPVWLDDFGSGYSSLDVLQSIQFDLLKFDMSFMKKLDDGDNGKIILTDLMRMATKLGLDTICEGVETEEQVRFLQEIGCAKLQGYYFSTPIPLSRVLQIVDEISKKNLENPEEEQYYKTIGRTNLYDFSVISNMEDTAFQNVFSTLPMGIIEIAGDSIHFVRTNQSYRDYMKRFFHVDISGSQTIIAEELFGSDSAYMKMLRQCCSSGNHMLFDEQLPDGSTAHSFVRRISVNPSNGTAAVAVAVLSVSSREEGTTYAEIVKALATDYYNIYYVDVETEKFIEYSLPSGQEELAVERHGDSFFEAVRRDAMTQIYEPDRDAFLKGFSKKDIIQALDQQGTFTRTYRLLIDGKPEYANLRIKRLHPDGQTLIIGISIIDSEMKQKEILDRIEKERDTMMRAIALTDGYLVLYTVDAANNHYVQYTASEDYERLGYTKLGDDFFLQGNLDGKRAVWEKDLERYLEFFSRDQVLKAIKEKGKFKLSYHLMVNGRPKPVSLFIVPFRDENGEMLLAGVREEGEALE